MCEERNDHMKTNLQAISTSVKVSLVAIALAIGGLLPVSAYAKAKPKDATAQCADGTFSKAKTKQGACSKHGGVKTWFGVASESAPSSAPAPQPPSTPATKTVTTKETSTKRVASSANAAQNATAKCKDGTFSYSKHHTGACSHHGGVAEWYK